MRICPICDHELIGAFCPLCKAVRKEALVIPDGIYLNKAHSAPDVQCEFHEHDRKSTLLNRRHPKNEEECSYHQPGLFHGTDPGADGSGADPAPASESGRLLTPEFRRLAKAAKTGQTGALFRKWLER